MSNQSVDLVMGSPPYQKQRSYGIAAQRDLDHWLTWALVFTREASRVSKGAVVWVVAGTGSTNYQPGPEGLIYLAHKAGIQILRPGCWVSNKPPTGGRWWSNDWEFLAGFTIRKRIPYWDPLSLRQAMKYANGGRFRQRRADGQRILGGAYPSHQFRKRPSNVFRVPVGGGLLGSDLAHENEAPYPEALIEPWIKVLVPIGGLVLDPFSGSGTTVAVAKRLDRIGIGLDIRGNQCELGARRQTEDQAQTAPRGFHAA